MRDVSEYLIHLSYVESGDGITNLKLQKLLYYVQGFYIALEGRVLFDDEIEAWTHGPVVREMYQAYQMYGYDSIDRVHGRVGDRLTDRQREVIADVWLVFRSYTAKTLEQLVQSEDPWQIARAGLSTYESAYRVVDVDVLGDFVRREYTYR